jgi:hypothetical protein
MMTPLTVGLRGWCAVGILFGAAACGETIAPTAPTQARITVSVTPNPVSAKRCVPLCTAPSGAFFPFEAAMNLTVQESAGISGNVDSILVRPVAAAGTALPALNYGADVIVQRSTTNHVAPGGIFTFFFAFFYATGVNNAGLTVNIDVQFTDDRGNKLTGTATVSVADPSPPSADAVQVNKFEVESQ